MDLGKNRETRSLLLWLPDLRPESQDHELVSDNDGRKATRWRPDAPKQQGEDDLHLRNSPNRFTCTRF